MSKRPFTQLQDEPEPVASKSTQSGDPTSFQELASMLAEAKSEEALAESMRAGVQSTRAKVLQKVYVQAMSDRKIKAVPDLDWCKRLIENNRNVQDVLHRAVGEGSFEAITSLGR